MTKIRMVVVSGALALSMTAVAAQRMFADFSGKWNVTITGQGASVQSTMTVTQNGDSVFGTTGAQLGSGNFEGVVKGDSIFLGVASYDGGQLIKMRFTGVMSKKDKMMGIVETEGEPAASFVAARQPN